jgi:hypothetical protein
MIRLKRLIVIAAFGLCLVSVGSMASAIQMPFQPGEELVFRIRWSFIPAGTAVLKVLEADTIDHHPAQHFMLTVKSNRFVDQFYKVRSQIDGWTDIAVSHSLLYKKRQDEGRHRRNVAVTFDWDAQTARYIDYYEGEKRFVKLMPGAFDPLSAAYYFRTLKLEKDIEIEYPVSDGKKCVMGRGRVIDREKIKIGRTTYDTWVIIPELKHVGGVFRKTKDAKIRLWVTADHRHLPVRITSKVVVGSFVGELIQSSGTTH